MVVNSSHTEADTETMYTLEIQNQTPKQMQGTTTSTPAKRRRHSIRPMPPYSRDGLHLRCAVVYALPQPEKPPASRSVFVISRDGAGFELTVASQARLSVWRFCCTLADFVKVVVDRRYGAIIRLDKRSAALH